MTPYVDIFVKMTT